MQKQVLPIESTRILNPAVKAFCALFAALLGARKQKKRRWLTGALCGVVYIVISLAVFGLASGEFSIGSSTAVDALMCLLAGMTGGDHTQPRRVSLARSYEIISFYSVTQLFYRLNRDIPQQPEQAICTVFVCLHFFRSTHAEQRYCVHSLSRRSRAVFHTFAYTPAAFPQARHCIRAAASATASFRKQRPGVLILPSAESPRTSCICAIKIPAGEHMPPRIIPQLMPSAAFSARYCSANLRSGSERLCEPLHNRCIVVRTGIVYPVFCHSVRQVIAVCIGVEPELKNAHAWVEARAFNKLMYLRCQETEIFRNER